MKKLVLGPISTRNSASYFSQQSRFLRCDGVLFVERAGELRILARLRNRSFGAAAKASLNRANKLMCVDPKPSDLPMASVKLR